MVMKTGREWLLVESSKLQATSPRPNGKTPDKTKIQIKVLKGCIVTACYCKTQIFACRLFHKFRELARFAKITGREYSNGNQLLNTCLMEASKYA